MNPPSPPNPRPGASATAHHPLTRSRTDRMIAGVAGGIARKYDFDPAIVRVVIIVLTVVSFGAALLAYGVAWLVIPESDADEPVLTSAVHGARRRPFDRRLWVGLILLFIGAEALAGQYGWHMGRFSRVFWPLALIGIGASVLLLRDRDDDPHTPLGPPGPSGGTIPVAPPPVAPSDAPATPDSPEPVADPPAAAGTGVGDAVHPMPSGFVAPSPPAPPTAYPPSLPWPDPSRPRVPRRHRRERSLLGRLTWSVLLMVAGAAWLLDVVGAVNVDARFLLALELAIVGGGLLVGTWLGRARGLIAIGLVLTVFAGVFSLLDVPLRGPIGETVVRPESLRTLHSSYDVGIGHLLLDLGSTAPDGRAHEIHLRDTIGFLEVRVPADARVEVVATADAGELDILGRERHGGTHFHKTVVDEPVGTSGPLLVIDAHVGFGSVRVTRAEGFTS